MFHLVTLGIRLEKSDDFKRHSSIQKNFGNFLLTYNDLDPIKYVKIFDSMEGMECGLRSEQSKKFWVYFIRTVFI
jgi:hypothetical protein